MRLLLRLALMLAALSPWLAHTAAAAELRPFGRGSWQQLRKAHEGRPTVVHFWGVTCGPCRTEMPLWGQFVRTNPDVNLVLVDADLVPNEPQAVTRMLRNAGLAANESWLFTDDFVERLRFEIDPQWQGEIPRTLLIARDGTTTLIEGVADLAQVRAWLDAQKKP